MKHWGSLVLTVLLIQHVLAAAYPVFVPEWEINLGGTSVQVADVEGSPNPEITIGSLGDMGSYAYLLNEEGILIWRNKISVIWPNNSPNSLIVCDLESDKKTDIVVGSVVEAKTCSASLSEYNHPIFVLERNPEVQNNMLKWVHRGYGLSMSLTVADVTGDGSKEVISGSRSGKVYVIDAQGNLLFTYDTEGTVNDVAVADLNKDGIMEVVAASYNYVHAFNKIGNRIWRYNTKAPTTAVYVSDFNRDNLGEVLAVTEDDQVHAISAGGDKLWTYNLTAIKPVVTAADFDKDGLIESVIASADMVYGLDATGKLKWTFDVDYPIVDLATFQRTNRSHPSLLTLGARKTTSHVISEVYLRDLAADADLSKATNYYERQNYTLARDHALVAMQTFSQLNDSLLYNLSYKLYNQSMLYLEADHLYGLARLNYSASEYKGAKELGVRAQRIYTILGDDNKTISSEQLVNDALNQIDGSYYYQRALEYLRAKEYVQGAVYAKKSVQIYGIVGDEDKIVKASKIVNQGEKYPLANEAFESAEKLYRSEKFYEAKDEAVRAQVLYEAVGDDGRLSATANLLAGIKEQIHILEESNLANEHLTRANKMFSDSNYVGCIEKADTSREIFLGISDAEGAGRAQAQSTACSAGLQAQRHYAKAVDYYTELEYDLALDHAQKARQLYRSIGDWDGGIQAGELIYEIEEEQKESYVDQELLDYLTYAILGLSALLTVLVILYLIRGRKKKKKMQEQLPQDLTTLVAGPASEDEIPDKDMDDLLSDIPVEQVVDGEQREKQTPSSETESTPIPTQSTKTGQEPISGANQLDAVESGKDEGPKVQVYGEGSLLEEETISHQLDELINKTSPKGAETEKAIEVPIVEEQDSKPLTARVPEADEKSQTQVDLPMSELGDETSGEEPVGEAAKKIKEELEEINAKLGIGKKKKKGY